MARTAAKSEAPGDAEQRGDDVLQQKAMLQQVDDAAYHLPGSRQNTHVTLGDGQLPDDKQCCNEDSGSNPHEKAQCSRPLLALRRVQALVTSFFARLSVTASARPSNNKKPLAPTCHAADAEVLLLLYVSLLVLHLSCR